MAYCGCLLSNSADVLTMDFDPEATVTFNQATYDTHSFKSGNDIVIPAVVNGGYGIFTASIATELSGPTACYVSIQKTAGTALPANAIQFADPGTGHSGTATWAVTSTPPVPLATGDSFRMRAYYLGDSSITVEGFSSFSLRVLASGLQTQRVVAKKAADQTTANYSTPAAVAWDGTDIVDTDTAHDPSSNNTKIIVPSAWNNKYIIVCANILTTLTAGGESSLGIRKNGSFDYPGWGGIAASRGNLSVGGRSAWTHPIQVSTGDEFEAIFYESDTSVTLEEEYSTFSAWVVGA
jgi:hypothetical protein